MKSTTLIFSIFFLFLMPCLGTGQNLFTRLGGAETNFTFLSNGQELRVLKQGIFHQIVQNYSQIDDASMEQYYLQILTKDSIQSKNAIKANFNKKSIVKIIFYDKNEKELFAEDLNINRFTSPKAFYYYSRRSSMIYVWNYNGYYVYTIDIKNIPFILLDEIESISIVQYDIRRE